LPRIFVFADHDLMRLLAIQNSQATQEQIDELAKEAKSG